MTDARALLRSGELTGALDALKKQVRKSPRDAGLRTFLFQLFCVTGEWDRAVTQAQAAAELDPLAIPMAQAYRAAIRCEILRERVFAGTRSPTIFGEPPEWLSLLTEVVRALATGRQQDALRMRDAAFEQAPVTAGTIDGAPFEWIADADPRLGPVLEAMIDGKYFWVPFARLKRLTIEPPADLRDQVFAPAAFVFENDGTADGFLPARYPGSAQSGARLALAQRTEWAEGDWPSGLGQKMFATDLGEFPLLDVRRIDFHR